MQVYVNTLLDSTVTVFNCISAKASKSGQDMFRPCVIYPASWEETTRKTTDADGTVHFKRSVRLQVPVTSAEYLEPRKWLSKAVKGSLRGEYTLCLHDVAILGEYRLRNDLTRSELNEYISDKPHCEIVSVKDCRNNSGVELFDDGCLKYLSVMFAEGI